METIVLEYPFKLADGRELKQVSLRRPKVRELKAAQRAGTGADDHELALIALLSEEKLTPEDLEEMDLADYSVVQQTFRRMATRQPNNPKAVGAAGQVVQVSAK